MKSCGSPEKSTMLALGLTEEEEKAGSERVIKDEEEEEQGELEDSEGGQKVTWP